MSDNPRQSLEDFLKEVPDELKKLRQWVTAKAKKPQNPENGQPASVADRSSWGTFEEAVEAFGNGGLDGIGFVFTADDPYVGVDLDKCRNPETGEIQPWAQEWIDGLGSYTELSQSGTGFHIIVKRQVAGDQTQDPL